MAANKNDLEFCRRGVDRRRWRRGVLLLVQSDVWGNLLRARFGNVIEPVGVTGRIYKALE